MRRRIGWLALAACPGIAGAAQIFGTLQESQHPVAANVAVVVQCEGNSYPGATDAFGSYSIFVPVQGRCTLTVQYGGRASQAFVVYSYADPARYDFDLVRAADGSYALARR